MFCHKLLLGRGERGNYFISGARLRLIIRRKERLLMTERVYSIRQPARGYRYLDADGRCFRNLRVDCRVREAVDNRTESGMAAARRRGTRIGRPRVEVDAAQIHGLR